MSVLHDQRVFRLGRRPRKRKRLPPAPKPPRFSRKHAQRMALVRHAMIGEETRSKAPITLPKLKFLET
jgi:hypothetical protein